MKRVPGGAAGLTLLLILMACGSQPGVVPAPTDVEPLTLGATVMPPPIATEPPAPEATVAPQPAATESSAPEAPVEPPPAARPSSAPEATVVPSPTATYIGTPPPSPGNVPDVPYENILISVIDELGQPVLEGTVEASIKHVEFPERNHQDSFDLASLQGLLPLGPPPAHIPGSVTPRSATSTHTRVSIAKGSDSRWKGKRYYSHPWR